MPSSDDVGNRGQSIFFELLTRFCGPKNEPLFRPEFLGDKFVTFDYLVELVGLKDRAAYFFVQVKTTTRGYTKGTPPRLKVNVSEQDVLRMAQYPAPTYVAGVDEAGKHAFLASVNGPSLVGIPSLTTRYPLEPRNLKILWDEVEAFWAGRDMILRDTAFPI